MDARAPRAATAEPVIIEAEVVARPAERIADVGVAPQEQTAATRSEVSTPVSIVIEPGVAVTAPDAETAIETVAARADVSRADVPPADTPRADAPSAETRPASTDDVPIIVVKPDVEFTTAGIPTSSSAAASTPPPPTAAPPPPPPALLSPRAAPAVAERASTASPSAPASASALRGTTDRERDYARDRDWERQPGLRILMIASEAVPFAKTGGLADVAGALPLALGRLGHDVTLVVPRYRGVEVVGEPVVTRAVQLGPERHTVKLYEQPLGLGARAWLLDEPALYDRDGGLYNANGSDHPDNPRRFALLARAALEGYRAAGFTPDVVHGHDWQAGLAAVYLRTRYARDPVLGGVPSVFTIHNLAYQGLFDPSWLPALDLGWDLFNPGALEYWHRISFLKAGILFSEKVTTVSPRYAQEILTPAFAFGFEGVLAARGADLVGILNGIDADVWNPATDPHIPRPYSVDDLSGKVEAKRALLQTYGLPSSEAALRVPLVGQVSRMVDQKGLDLIAQIAAELPQTGARFVILGTGEPHYEQMWRSLAAAHPDRIAVKIGFDEALSHLLEAGSDLFLMPSRFEPCGLNQMYSLRYGTLPLVRATGGLDDTVENYDPSTGRGNGFKFWEPSGPALLNTLRWALRVYEHPEVWQRLQREAMRADFSWDRSARAYADLYAQVARAPR